MDNFGRLLIINHLMVRKRVRSTDRTLRGTVRETSSRMSIGVDWRVVIHGIREFGWEALRPVWVGAVAEEMASEFRRRFGWVPNATRLECFARANGAFDEWKAEMGDAIAPYLQIVSCSDKDELEKLIKGRDFIVRPGSLVAFVMESKRLCWDYVCRTYRAKGRKYVAHWFWQGVKWYCISYQGEELMSVGNHFKGHEPGCHHHLSCHLVDPRMTWHGYEDKYIRKGGHSSWGGSHLKVTKGALTPDFAMQLPRMHPDRIRVESESVTNADAIDISDRILNGIISRLEHIAGHRFSI